MITTPEKIRPQRIDLFLTLCVIFFLIILAFAGCKTAQEESQTKKLNRSQLITGTIKPGPVSLDPLGIEFILPTTVYANADRGQWLAHSSKGAFKIAAALFDDPANPTDPEKIVKSRAKQLLGESVEAYPLSYEELKRMGTVGGYTARLVLKESPVGSERVLASRTYLIRAQKYPDGSVLVLSIDANDRAFTDVDSTFDSFIASMKTINRPANNTEPGMTASEQNNDN